MNNIHLVTIFSMESVLNLQNNFSVMTIFAVMKSTQALSQKKFN